MVLCRFRSSIRISPSTSTESIVLSFFLAAIAPAIAAKIVAFCMHCAVAVNCYRINFVSWFLLVAITPQLLPKSWPSACIVEWLWTDTESIICHGLCLRVTEAPRVYRDWSLTTFAAILLPAIADLGSAALCHRNVDIISEQHIEVVDENVEKAAG
ncbi:hypothetical protein CR513_26823, partial [Mucuna pruriens]